MWAAHSGRRELYVGVSTVQAIAGNKIAAGCLDRVLARIGYAAQQTNEPEEADRPHNLWVPVPGDHGAHGRFDAFAHETSVQLWISQHRGRIATACALLTVPVSFALWLRSLGNSATDSRRVAYTS